MADVSEEVHSFDVLARGLADDAYNDFVEVCPLTSIKRLNRLKKHAEVTICVPLECFDKLVNGEVCGGLLMMDVSTFKEIQRKLMDERGINGPGSTN